MWRPNQRGSLTSLRTAWTACAALLLANCGGVTPVDLNAPADSGSDAWVTSCVYMGVVHPRMNHVFPSGDGCNTCACTIEGTVACTNIDCSGRDATPPGDGGAADQPEERGDTGDSSTGSDGADAGSDHSGSD